MAQSLGLINFFWNGAQIDIEQGGTVQLGGLVNNTVIAGKKVLAAQKMVESMVEITIPIQSGQTVTSIFGSATTNEMQVQCDSGQTFTWDDAFQTDVLKFTAGGDGGKMKVTFAAGIPVEL